MFSVGALMFSDEELVLGHVRHSCTRVVREKAVMGCHEEGVDVVEIKREPGGFIEVARVGSSGSKNGWAGKWCSSEKQDVQVGGRSKGDSRS